MKYNRYSYPKIFAHKFIYFLWKKFFCKCGWHLWDEVASLEEHYLVCDACEETIHINDKI